MKENRFCFPSTDAMPLFLSHPTLSPAGFFRLPSPLFEFHGSQGHQSYVCLHESKEQILHGQLFPCLFLGLFLDSAFFSSDCRGTFSNLGVLHSSPSLKAGYCESKCRSPGSGALPEGIVVTNSNLEMGPLWGSPKKTSLRSYLFGVAVGIKQKQIVDKMVTKFLNSNFTVMLFHYDGVVDDWKDLEWSVRVVHESAFNQTKWWSAKRFLHPDIVAEYDNVFLWDEDLGVENFHPDQWIEMTAPVFSRAAWCCVWYMIQNDLILAWGFGMQLGYCAQGDRMKNVGIVDAEYIVHYNRPTLGGTSSDKAPPMSMIHDPRVEVRRQSYIELDLFKQRWKKAVEEDKCRTDPYPPAAE